MPVANTARSYRPSTELKLGQVRAEVQTSSTRSAGFGHYVLGFVMITAALLFYVYLHVGTLAIGYQLSQIRAEQLKLVRENRALQTEVGSLSTPSRIRQIATEKLGMRSAHKILTIEGGR